MPITAFKKKLHTCRPRLEAEQFAARVTKAVVRPVAADPRSIERGVRQRLADKISDNTAGLWLLIPEHLRLGTWDLLCGWTGQSPQRVEPRLALQLVHEAALCSNGVRTGRCLTMRGFETLNGLPFLGHDRAVHELLAKQEIAPTQDLQKALGKIRRASGHYPGTLLLIDPHRPRSYSRRHMRRCRKGDSRPFKSAQTFFCLDGQSWQPLCFTTATSARTVSQAMPDLLPLVAEILDPPHKEYLVAADAEHFTTELFDYVHGDTPFDLITPMPNQQKVKKRLQQRVLE